MSLTLLSLANREHSGTGSSSESRLDRLLKMTPTEVLSIYPVVLALAAVIAWPYYEPAIASLGLVAVVMMLRHDGKQHLVRPSWQQHLVRCLVFAAWTLVIGNPLAPLSISAEEARLLGVTGAAFIPIFGYLGIESEEM